MTEPLPLPGEIVPNLPESMERFLLKALAKEPADRYADLGAFIKELESLLSHYDREAKEEAERNAQEKAERDVVEKAAREKAELEAIEKAEREKAERAALEKAERDAVEKSAREKPVADGVRRTRKPLAAWVWIAGGAVILLLALTIFVAGKWLPLSSAPSPTTLPTETNTAAPIKTTVSFEATITPFDIATSTTAAPYVCTDPLGCVKIAPGDPIHLAYSMVISGPDETLGIDSRTGVEVAIALKGKVLGHDVQLTGEDDGCSAEGGQAAGTKLA